MSELQFKIKHNTFYGNRIDEKSDSSYWISNPDIEAVMERQARQCTTIIEKHYGIETSTALGWMLFIIMVFSIALIIQSQKHLPNMKS